MKLVITFAPDTTPKQIEQVCGSTRLPTYTLMCEPVNVRRLDIPDEDWGALSRILAELIKAKEVVRFNS